MKKATCFILLLFCFFQPVSGQKMQKAPPGTVRINDTLFADIHEVDNIAWREYLYYLIRFDSASGKEALPDTLVWGVDSSYISIQQYYFRHPGFNSYPLVGISYQQAVAFCKWRTNAANFALYIKENNISDWERHLDDHFPVRFYYRLPTEKEWEMIASGNKPVEQYPWGCDSVYRKWKKKYRKVFNCKYPEDLPADPHRSIAPFYTVPGISYWPNTYHVYTLIGNVAEMVQEEGIAKGGSFDHSLDDCKITNRQTYTRPERWLGFRCVCVAIQVKKD